jgi:hypothetical protein
MVLRNVAQAGIVRGLSDADAPIDILGLPASAAKSPGTT